jgi:hypothetical protein
VGRGEKIYRPEGRVEKALLARCERRKDIQTRWKIEEQPDPR